MMLDGLPGNFRGKALAFSRILTRSECQEGGFSSTKPKGSRAPFPSGLFPYRGE